MTARLILPDVHHVSGGGDWLTDVLLHGKQPRLRARSPRVCWWRVDAEYLDMTDMFDADGNIRDSPGPPADLVKLAEPCDTCLGFGWLGPDEGNPDDAWPLPNESRCPDCVEGKRIVQLVQMCSLRHRGHQHGLTLGDLSVCRSDGTVPVARATITLLPVYAKPSDSPTVDAWCSLVGPTGDGSSVVMFALPGRDKSQRPDLIVLPFKVEPGQCAIRAEEVTT